MKWVLSTFITACFLINPAKAQTFDWTSVNLPVQSNDWNTMPQTGRAGYAVGAAQMAAYLSQDDSHQTCVAGLYVMFLEKTNNQPRNDALVLEIDDLTKTVCGTAQAPSSSLMSSNDIVEAFSSAANKDAWFGFVLGMADYLGYRMYAVYGAEASDCVKGMTLRAVRLDTNSPASWTETPNEPFVESIIAPVLKACDLG